ncbi:MAG: hypothetical protein AMXMBFR34_07560 [Myxococcaceae bacterium]
MQGKRLTEASEAAERYLAEGRGANALARRKFNVTYLEWPEAWASRFLPEGTAAERAEALRDLFAKGRDGGRQRPDEARRTRARVREGCALRRGYAQAKFLVSPVLRGQFVECGTGAEGVVRVGGEVRAREDHGR